MDPACTLRPVILLSILAVATVTDIIGHRVGNRLILAGFALETVVFCWYPEVMEPSALAAAMVFLTLMFVLFILRMTGGADIKLFALCIFSYPNARGLSILAASLLTAGMYSAYILICRGLLKERMAYLCSFIGDISLGIRREYIEAENIEGILIVPMAAFIFIAAVIVLIICV